MPSGASAAIDQKKTGTKVPVFLYQAKAMSSRQAVQREGAARIQND